MPPISSRGDSEFLIALWSVLCVQADFGKHRAVKVILAEF